MVVWVVVVYVVGSRVAGQGLMAVPRVGSSRVLRVGWVVAAFQVRVRSDRSGDDQVVPGRERLEQELFVCAGGRGGAGVVSKVLCFRRKVWHAPACVIC